MEEKNKDNSNLGHLIIKLIDGTISEKEADGLIECLKDEDNLEYFNEFIILNYLITNKSEFDYKPSLKKFDNLVKEKKTLHVFSVFKYAAAILILLSVGYFFINNTDILDNDPIIVNNNIEAGADKAKLTLADGTIIFLERGENYKSSFVKSTGEKLVYEEVQKVETPEVLYNTLTVPRGGQFHIVLSDKTKIWLNSDSQLKYPVAFIEGETRQVELVYGEAYFDVSSSKTYDGAKFMVKMKDQEVEVLGTKFNIKAYNNESSIYTTLIEGRVYVRSELGNKLLVPSQQSILNKNAKLLNVKQVANVFEEIGWLKGEFIFNNKSLKDIMNVLERWYDIKVVFQEQSLELQKFTGTLRKSQNIEDVLLLMKAVNCIQNFEINNKTVVLK